MNIYHYQPITKEYLGHGVADVDPLDSTNHLIPANCTTVECALEDKEGFTKNFNEDTQVWEYQEIPQPTPRPYNVSRAVSYPSIGDQLDALFHAGAFPEDMAALIQAVKDAHPKPETSA